MRSIVGVSVAVGNRSVSVGVGVGVSVGVNVGVSVKISVNVGGGSVPVGDGSAVREGKAVSELLCTVKVGVGDVRPAGFPARRTSARPVQ